MSTVDRLFAIRRYKLGLGKLGLHKLALGLMLGLALSINPCAAGEPTATQFTPVDWQSPESLPPRFRNHCGTDFWSARYCADHCGLGYQFYFCSGHSFGCCHVGVGYCDWNGSLRCAPTL